jgi:hypothetical protein
MLGAMAEPTSAPPPIFGVTLEQYAGVNAAVLEGFGLPEVLTSEGLEAAIWPRCAVGWSGRIAKAGVGGLVSLTYQEKIAFAQEWLGRRIEPLCDDLDAWFGFLGAWSAPPAPFDLLEDLGLQATDVARVQGAWTRRIEADEKLRKRVVEVALKRLSAIPKLTVTKATLRPFPWSHKAALTVQTTSGVAAADALLAQDARRLLAHAAARRGAAEDSSRAGARENQTRRDDVPSVVATPPELPVALQRVVPPFAGTALALDLPRGPALPFMDRGAATAITANPADGEAKIFRPPVNLGGTALAIDVPRGPALPFARTPEASIADQAEGEPGAQHQPVNLRGTALAVDVPRGPALPFSQSGLHAPVIASSSEGEPEIARPVAKLGGTALAVDVPRGPALPFARAGSSAPEPDSAGSEPRSPSPAVAKRSKLAGLSFGLSIPNALPLARSALPAAPKVEPKVFAAVPAPQPPPPLTLEQHASLCAELSFAPESEAEILARYWLTAPAKLLVDQFYRERVGESAEARAVWDRGYREYFAWLVNAATGRR